MRAKARPTATSTQANSSSSERSGLSKVACTSSVESTANPHGARPSMDRAKVVLPEPEGPRRTTKNTGWSGRTVGPKGLMGKNLAFGAGEAEVA